MNEEEIEQLIGLGLTRYEAAVYRALLERQSFTPAQAAAHAGVPRQRIYDVLASLSARGLCVERHNGEGRSFYAIDPNAALPALIAERQRQHEAEQSRLQATAEQLMQTLAPFYRAGNDQVDPLDYIDVLLDPRRVSERAVRLAAHAEREICVLFKRPLIGGEPENFAEVQGPLQRGVRYRTLYEREVLDDPAVASWIARFIGWGQHARVIDELPIKCNLFDDRVALLSLQDPITGTPSVTALCVTHPGFARMLTVAFEGLWAQAEPIPQ